MNSTPTCIACGASGWTIAGLKDRDGKPLRSVACEVCGLIRVDPLPDMGELRRFYEEEYRLQYKGIRQPRLKHVYRAGRLALDRLDTLRTHLPAGGRVLDVGAGGGEWLYVLEQSGYRPRGIEPDAGYGGFAREVLGVDVTACPMWEAVFNAGSFEAVTLFHVLEHLPEPLTALRQCREWLADGSRIIVEVPNIGSRHQHPRKRFHPAHLYGFSPATLRRVLGQAGFAIAFLETGAFDRNILAVGVKTDEPRAPSEPEPAGRYSESLWSYYASPATYWRFGRRMSGLLREALAVAGQRDARSLLDGLIAAHR